MSKITELASGQITTTDSVKIELVEADETPAVVIVTWPSKASVLHPHRFPTAADVCARTFAAAVVRLAPLFAKPPGVEDMALRQGGGGREVLSYADQIPAPKQPQPSHRIHCLFERRTNHLTC